MMYYEFIFKAGPSVKLQASSIEQAKNHLKRQGYNLDFLICVYQYYKTI